jgi:hypothetical protein
LESSPNLLLWSDLATVDIGASCEAQVRCELTEGESLFLRAIRQEAWDCVSIGTQGAAFSPRIECSGSESPVIRWAFDGGTTSSAYPEATIDYGTAAARTHVLTVRPPARLTELNLGYDGGDGGTAPVDYIAPQDVTSISFPHPIETLRVFCASNNTALTSLDLSAQSGLEIVECYCTSNLRNVKVAGLANVRRLCFEDCDLDALDISGCPALEDLRGAVNSYTRIDVGGGTGPNIWHWCTRDNPQLQQEFCDFMGSFTSMRELYIWNDNQHGVFKIGSHVLTELLAAQNHYTSVVLGDQPDLRACDFNYNELTSFFIGACPALQELNLGHNDLPTEQIDAILALLVAGCPALTRVDLAYNAGPPSEAGMAYVATLRARGVNVIVDEPDENDGLYDIEGGDDAVTFTTQSTSVSMEIRTSSTPTSITWHWGDGSITTGAYVVTHEFSSTVEHVNYVEVIPSDCVTYFGAQMNYTNQGITGVRHLSNFANLDFLYLYTESVDELSLAGCGKLLQLHLASNPFDSATCDQLFIDLDAATGAGPFSDADFYFPSTARTSASDAAYASLVAKGYQIHPY